MTAADDFIGVLWATVARKGFIKCPRCGDEYCVVNPKTGAIEGVDVHGPKAVCVGCEVAVRGRSRG